MAFDERQFWGLIEASRTLPGNDQGTALRSLLSELPLEDVVEFQNIFYRMKNRADTGKVYGAGSLIRGRLLSDSTSSYFLNWLVAQGYAAYERAICDPDTLAEFHIANDPWDEDVAYAAAEVFESKSSDDFYDQLAPDVFPDPLYDWSIYTASYLEQHLPKLWAKYGKVFKD